MNTEYIIKVLQNQDAKIEFDGDTYNITTKDDVVTSFSAESLNATIDGFKGSITSLQSQINALNDNMLLFQTIISLLECFKEKNAAVSTVDTPPEPMPPEEVPSE